MLIKSPRKVKNKRNVQEDTLLQFISTRTAEEIEAYFDNQVSVIANATDSAIDNYVDNISDLAGAKVALKLIAKDSAFNSNMLKKLTKMVAVLADKEFNNE